MKVAVIIPAINEAGCIARAVESAWQAAADEIVVVDGGSRDGTADCARAGGADVIASPAGRAVQMNAGAERASSDILLFQHADNWLDPDAIHQIKQTLGHRPQVLAGAFRQSIDAAGWPFRWLERGNARRVTWLGAAYGDQGIFVRREVFEAVGRFPEIELMEDVVLMRRLRRRAWPVLLPGPIRVDPRRWIQHGVFRQTLRNWTLVTAFRCGVSPKRLASFYPRHDRQGSG